MIWSARPAALLRVLNCGMAGKSTHSAVQIMCVLKVWILFVKKTSAK